MSMQLKKLFKRCAAEDGAVSVDWVVLTAAVVGFGYGVGHIIWGQTDNAAFNVADFMAAQTVKPTFE